MPVTAGSDDELLVLADHLRDLRFLLSGDDAPAWRAERDRVVRLLRGVVSRTAEPRAPLLVVVGGGSGAGKSTTVNSLAGAAVARADVVRPTTRYPTLVCNPDDRAWFSDDRVLPDLPRAGTAEAVDASRQLRIAVSDALPVGVALLDTPDIDSVEVANHRLAEESLDAADGWLWLATGRTYADEVGMVHLRRARSRQALTAVAITQLRPDEQEEILRDVGRLLVAEGIEPDLLVGVPFSEVVDSRLPPDTVLGLRTWLEALAPTDRRVEVRAAATAGLRAALPVELVGLRDAVDAERAAAERMRVRVAANYAELPDQLEAELESGLSLRADVLERWQQLVGGGEALLRVQTVLGQVGDLVRTGLGRPTAQDTRQVRVEVAGELTRIVHRLLGHAAVAVRRELEADPRGRDLLAAVAADDADLRGDDPHRETRVRDAIAGWERFVAERIETVGGPRKAQARRRSTALNAVATSAILVLFTLSGGLTGGEVGIAAAAAAASQWLLVRMLGEQNVRRLLDDIGADLRRRVSALAAAERQRVDDAIAAAAPASPAWQALRTIAGPSGPSGPTGPTGTPGTTGTPGMKA